MRSKIASAITLRRVHPTIPFRKAIAYVTSISRVMNRDSHMMQQHGADGISVCIVTQALRSYRDPPTMDFFFLDESHTAEDERG